MKRFLYAFLCFTLLCTCLFTVTNAAELELSSQSVCLIEASTGKVLYENNADEKLEPASVTKIMSLLLVMEAIDNGTLSLDDEISGSAHSSSMGGSQIWLEADEKMSAHEMLKAVVVSSANDCTVALAEHLAGSEETFVEKMNAKAKDLGMQNTHFSNCTGLPAAEHYTTARDIAIMSSELLKHEKIFEYTTIWMDTVRGGQMGLSNTNKLIRFYSGANGLKTGFTSSALYCLSAAAKRGDMQLIAATMKAPTSDQRFSDAKKLLDYGFANYSLYAPTPEIPKSVKVKGGICDNVKVSADISPILLKKGDESRITPKITIEKSLSAPVKKSQNAGFITYSVDGKEVAKYEILTLEPVRRMTFGDIFKSMFTKSVAIR